MKPRPRRASAATSAPRRPGSAIAVDARGTDNANRTAKRFSRPILAGIEKAKILGVRAGSRSGHRFTGIWAVVVGDRVFARSWTQKPGGWYRTFQDDPRGTIQLGGREIPVRAVPARGNRLRDAIEQAYAAKYPTPGSARYVRGFRTHRRRETTTEFVPR